MHTNKMCFDTTSPPLSRDLWEGGGVSGRGPPPPGRRTIGGGSKSNVKNRTTSDPKTVFMERRRWFDFEIERPRTFEN